MTFFPITITVHSRTDPHGLPPEIDAEVWVNHHRLSREGLELSLDHAKTCGCGYCPACTLASAWQEVLDGGNYVFRRIRV